jgi:hypothetical protein
MRMWWGVVRLRRDEVGEVGGVGEVGEGVSRLLL